MRRDAGRGGGPRQSDSDFRLIGRSCPLDTLAAGRLGGATPARVRLARGSKLPSGKLPRPRVTPREIPFRAFPLTPYTRGDEMLRRDKGGEGITRTKTLPYISRNIGCLVRLLAADFISPRVFFLGKNFELASMYFLRVIVD